MRSIEIDGVDFTFEDDLGGGVRIEYGGMDVKVPIDAVDKFTTFCLLRRSCADFAAKFARIGHCGGVPCQRRYEGPCVFRVGEDVCVLGAALLKQWQANAKGGK